MNKIKTLLVIITLSLSLNMVFAQTNPSYESGKRTVDYFLTLLDRIYVDTLDFNALSEKGVKEMITTLDPHSIYTTAKDVAASREPLQGSFDGVGITFQLIKDTTACGKSITNTWVRDHLRGKKGTKVQLGIKRGKSNELLYFTVTRGKIPMHSINVYFMIDKTTGYIKLDRFAQTSLAEFQAACTKLQEQGMKNLIFDLRGNGGGYLNTAVQIASQFIEGNKLLVYTDNFRKTGETLKSLPNGMFREGRLIVLIDENSASASEITSGAVQDWDRGIIMGRRSFGKGLVQKPVDLPNGAEVRVTISHYYTPTGRCIQKPYDDRDDYFKDISNRYSHGELFSPDSINFPDSLKYKTPAGKTVYGGGGIMPDIFVPMDTMRELSFR